MKRGLQLQTKTKWSQFDVTFLGLTSLVVVLTRWFFHTNYLLHWDSVQFALALYGVDVANHRPHPPGYIFYVWLGNLFKLFTGDDNIAFITLGIVASIAVIILVYVLANQIFKNRLAGVIAVILCLFNTLVAFQGMVAEVYIVEAAIALGAILLLYRYWLQPTLLGLISIGIILGLLGGVRQVTEVALLPLLIYILIVKQRPKSDWLLVGAVGCGANLLWFVPILMTSGGWTAYWHSLFVLARSMMGDYVSQHGFWAKTVMVMKTMGQVMNVTILWELVLGYILISSLLIRHQRSSRVTFHLDQVLFWFITVIGLIGIVILTLVANPGYILVPLILLLIGLGGGLTMLLSIVSTRFTLRWGRLMIGFIVAILVGHQIYNFYTLAPDQPSHQAIVMGQRLLSGVINGIRTTGTPRQTAVWIDSTAPMVFFDIRQLQYYLPGYDIYRPIPNTLSQKNVGKTIWHANGIKNESFESNVNLGPEITKLFVIRRYWNDLRDQYQTSIMVAPNRYLVYYNLTDPITRQYVIDKFKAGLNINET